jgi:hypothetical protein
LYAEPGGEAGYCEGKPLQQCVGELFLATYGKGASWISEKISTHSKKWVERVSGAGLVITAVLLSLKNNTQSQGASE